MSEIFVLFMFYQLRNDIKFQSVAAHFQLEGFRHTQHEENERRRRGGTRATHQPSISSLSFSLFLSCCFSFTMSVSPEHFLS